MLNECKGYKTAANAQRVIDNFTAQLHADTKAAREYPRMNMRPVYSVQTTRWVPCLIVPQDDLWFGMNLWHASGHKLLICVQGTCCACNARIAYTDVLCAAHRM